MRPLQGILDAASTNTLRKRVSPDDMTPQELLLGNGSNKMRRMLEGDRQHLVNGQNKLKPPPGVAPAPGIMNDFRFATMKPDQFAPSMIMPSMPNKTEANANSRLPLSRMLHSFPNQPLLQLPSKHEFVILKKAGEPKGENIKMGGGAGGQQDIFGTRFQQGLGNSFLGMNNNVRNQEMLNGHTIFSMNPSTWNPMMTQECKKLWENPSTYEDYMSLTPGDVWWGHEKFPGFTGFSFDGVVRNEESADGKATRESNGFETASLGPNRPTRPKTDAKLETVVQAGSTEVHDYGLGQGLMEGARMWCRLSKVPLADVNGTRQRFVISAKSAVLAIPAEGVTQDVSVMGVAALKILLGATKPEAADRLKYPLRPFMLQFFYTPSGESPHPSMYEYEDEEGVMHYDALIMPLGRVEFAPIKYHLMPMATAADLKPTTNGYELMVRHFLTLLIDPLKDGIFANV